MAAGQKLGDALRGHSVVGLDTMAFIYLLENNETYAKPIDRLFDEIEGGRLKGVTSTISLMETLVQPKRVGDSDLADDYFYALTSFPNLTLRPMDTLVAVEAAGLRARYGLKSPNAIQLAACITGGADVFVTNDADMKKIREIDVLVLSDFVEK